MQNFFSNYCKKLLRKKNTICQTKNVISFKIIYNDYYKYGKQDYNKNRKKNQRKCYLEFKRKLIFQIINFDHVVDCLN